jgi:hypothetical protein
MIKGYWWREVANFGDALAPLLLKRFAYLKTEWAPISRSRIASIGSILEHIPPLWDGYILGSGRLFENSRLHLVQHRSGLSSKILALRGPLSAKGIPGSFALGDPGLLADELVGPQEKTHDIGLVAHWQDEDLVPRFTRLMPSGTSIKVIRTGDNTLQVLRDIGSCKKIVTSSLHGMIVADGFGIPRRVEVCNRMWKDGGDFKFRDYSASIQTEFKTGVVQEPQRTRIEDVKFCVYDAYRELSKRIKR